MNEFLNSKKTKAASPPKENAASQIQLQPNDSKSLKWKTTLSHLLRGPRHRFDAERWGDHCIHSTVSSLTQDHNLQINREWRRVPTRFGTNCRVMAYWVADLSRAHAMRLVAKHRAKKNGG